MIIFHGAYSFISVGLTFLYLKVIDQLDDIDDSNYPFGKSHFEPLTVILKSVVIIGMCFISVFNAIGSLIDGGHDMDLNIGIYYSVISAFSCLLMAFFLKRRNKIIGSNLIKAELNQWIGDATLSFAVLFGFIICLILKSQNDMALLKYIDSIMVIVASFLFVILPIKTLKEGILEILCRKASKQITIPIENVCKEIDNSLYSTSKLRISQIGRRLLIEVNFLLQKRDISIAEMDEIRNKLANEADLVNKKHWININFTNDQFWL